MSLWRALMQGVGWRVGREMAEDLIASVKSDVDAPEPPEETPAKRAERLRVAAERAAAEAEAARVARTAKNARDRREVDRELEALKKKLGR